MSKHCLKAEEWNKFYTEPHSLESFFYQLYTHSEFLSLILDMRPATILEIGVGQGTFISFLSLLGLRCIGMDNSEAIINIAKKFSNLLAIRYKLCVADGFYLPFRDKSFDLCISQGLLEHFSDQEIERLLEEQLRVARRIIFSVPSRYYRRRDFGNERLLGRKRWESILRRYNLVLSRDYCYRRLKRNFLFKLPLMYCFVIEE